MGYPQRQRDGEGGPRAFDAPYGHGPTVRRRHVFHDREAQAGTAGGPRTGRIDPVEAFEDPLQVALGDADALVFDADLHPVPVAARGDHHAGPLPAGGPGVLETSRFSRGARTAVIPRACSPGTSGPRPPRAARPPPRGFAFPRAPAKGS